MNNDLLEFVRFKDLEKWDIKEHFLKTIKSSFPLEKLEKHIIHQTKKESLFDFPNKKFEILGVSNKIGMFDAEKLLGKQIFQKYHIVENNWLAYNPYRINVGSIGLKTELQNGKYISPAYVVFSCKETLLPEYLYLLMKSQTFNYLININTTGSVRQTLHFENLAEIKIPVPSLAEQKEILSHYNSLLNQATLNLEQATTLEQSIEQYLCDTLGIQIQEAKQKKDGILQFVRFKDLERWDVWVKKESLLSKEYKTVKLKDIIKGQPFYGANEKAIKKNRLEDTDIRYIRITDINEDGSLGNDYAITKNIDEKYLLKENDFLLARSGATVGKSFLYTHEYGKSIFAGYLIKFTLNSSIVNPKYLLFYSKSRIFKSWILSNQRVSAQPNINGKEFLQADIPLPPLEIQESIVKHIDGIKKQVKEHKATSQNLQTQAKEYFENTLFVN